MSRSQNLRHNVINHMLESIAQGHVQSPLPPQAALAEMFTVSRTTVRHVLSYLHERGVLEKVKDSWVIVRAPEAQDSLNAVMPPIDQQASLVEKRFFDLINQRQLQPGDTFSELQLAKQACQPGGRARILTAFYALQPAGTGQTRPLADEKVFADVCGKAV